MSILSRIFKPGRRWMIFNPGTGLYYTTAGPSTHTWTHHVHLAMLFTWGEADQMMRGYARSSVAVIMMEVDA